MRDSAARVFGPALVVLALVAVVALASTGSTPTGTQDSRPPHELLLDSFYSVMLVLLALSALMVVYALTQRKAIAAEFAKGRHHRLGLVGFTVFMFVFTLLVYFRLRDWNQLEPVVEIGNPPFPEETPGGAGFPQEPGGPQTEYEPEFAWLPVLVLVAVVALAVAVWYATSRRRPHGGADGDTVAEAVALVLDDALDDLRAEKDPRRAVIAAYARLERILAAHGLGRKPSEAPQEYLNRILPRLELERGSVRRLTDLFMRAKFSTHTVSAGMKEEAIEALTTVRDELRASDERRRKEQLATVDVAAGEL